MNYGAGEAGVAADHVLQFKYQRDATAHQFEQVGQCRNPLVRACQLQGRKFRRIKFANTARKPRQAAELVVVEHDGHTIGRGVQIAFDRISSRQPPPRMRPSEFSGTPRERS
jgi:hypothetical protein